jgi:hypothetical protein
MPNVLQNILSKDCQGFFDSLLKHSFGYLSRFISRLFGMDFEINSVLGWCGKAYGRV